MFTYDFYYRANFKNETFEIDINLPLLRIESKYKVNGKVLVLPIEGYGKFVGNFSKSIIILPT